MLLIFLLRQLMSNVISDNIISRLILILRKQFLDNQFTQVEKFCVPVQCKYLKGLYFVA